jgi:hypothetical protein
VFPVPAGLDYTVAHYGIITSEPRLDCVLTFVNDTTPEAADGWAVGEVGGFEAYLLADEEEETAGAAAVYRQVSNECSPAHIRLAQLVGLLADEEEVTAGAAAVYCQVRLCNAQST